MCANGESINKVKRTYMEWISVNLKLPESIGTYLCYCNDGTQIVCKINVLGQWMMDPPRLYWGDLNGNWGKTNREVTHWMELPKAPSE